MVCLLVQGAYRTSVPNMRLRHSHVELDEIGRSENKR